MDSKQAANIEEAVELAYELKVKGEYNWFRGQVQVEWPPVSSLHRVLASDDTEKQERALRRVEMFFKWVGTIPELKYLQEPEHVNDFFSIMQHYGIPTHYIDFTTDPGVAGFFAADTTSPPVEGQSCIYCLNTEELMSYWDILKDLDERKGANIELVEIDVQNLWRLQAQRGVFLFATYNWQIDYSMFKIVFPYSGYPSYPTREGIYPKDKSPLEQLLDQYFDLERATFVNEEMQQMIEGIKSRGGSASYAAWKPFTKGFHEPAFTDSSRMVPLESWSSESLKPWEVALQEDFHQTIGPTIKLKLNPHAGIEEVRKSVRFGVKQFLRSEPASRSKTVNWLFTELPESLSQSELDDILRPVWNGMRRLPYEDNDIADAFGSVAVLLMIGFQKEYRDNQLKRFSECFGEGMFVGFANLDGSGSGAVVARESLRRAVRTDMTELLVPEFKELANDVHDIFRIIYNPRLMFDFNEFKNLFAREVIPTQSVLKRDLILFNPARLLTFGLP